MDTVTDQRGGPDGTGSQPRGQRTGVFLTQRPERGTELSSPRGKDVEGSRPRGRRSDPPSPRGLTLPFPRDALSSVTRLPRQLSPSFPTLRANLLPASDTPQSFFWWSLACPLRVCPVCQLFGSKSSQGPVRLGRCDRAPQASGSDSSCLFTAVLGAGSPGPRRRRGRVPARAFGPPSRCGTTRPCAGRARGPRDLAPPIYDGTKGPWRLHPVASQRPRLLWPSPWGVRLRPVHFRGPSM